MRKAAVLVTAIALALVAWPGAIRPAIAEGITEMPVSFQVVNGNHTAVRCNADGKNYTVRGHIVAPSGAMTATADG